MDSGDQQKNGGNDKENNAENHNSTRYNLRKRKQISNRVVPARRAKTRTVSNNVKRIAMECNEQFYLDRLPMFVLVQIVSNLGVHDQENFADTCKIAKGAVQQYWKTHRELHIGSLMTHTFPSVNSSKHRSLHAIRDELAVALRLIPSFALHSIHFQPVCAIHVQDLHEIEFLTVKNAKEIYGELKHLDLRGCALEYDELKYFSRACSKLSSIAITHNSLFLPDEVFISEEYIKQKEMKIDHPLEEIRGFLRTSLPNFTEMEKTRELRAEHIDLLAKLLKLFPCLETFQID